MFKIVVLPLTLLATANALPAQQRGSKPSQRQHQQSDGNTAGKLRGAGRPPALKARLFSPGYDPRSVAEVDDEPISVGSIHLRPSDQTDVKAWWALNSDDLIDAEMGSLSCAGGCTISIYNDVSCAELGPEDVPSFAFDVSTSCDDDEIEGCDSDSGRGNELIEGVRQPMATGEGDEKSRARGDSEKPARGEGMMQTRGDGAQIGGDELGDNERKMLKIAVLSDGDVMLGCGHFKPQRRYGRKGGRKNGAGEQTEDKASRMTEAGKQTERETGRKTEAGKQTGRKAGRGPSSGPSNN